MKYNLLTVNFDIADGNKVLCICDCGTEKFISKYNVIKGITKSCGCLKKESTIKSAEARRTIRIEDWLNKKINYLTILGEECITTPSGITRRYFRCLCDCGNTYKGIIYSIISNNTISCGCYKKSSDKRPKSHGMSRTRFYNIWCSMIARTTNPEEPCYHNYGGRGIQVCDRWKSFENFRDDMFNTYSEELSLDRINVDLGYSLENCRWADARTQNHNKRKKPDSKSDYIGVTLDAKTLKWRARIAVSKTNRKHLGMFLDELSAAIAYDNASEEIYGDRPNKTIK